MSIINLNKFMEILKQDPEFVRETRYLNESIKIVIGEEVSIMKFENGELLEVDVGAPKDTKCEIYFAGETIIWKKMLEDKPKPFYQSLQSTALRHGLQMSHTAVTYAYMPAINRMMQLMREMCNEGVTQ